MRIGDTRESKGRSTTAVLSRERGLGDSTSSIANDPSTRWQDGDDSHRSLVCGYLTAVAAHLGRRRIGVRALHVDTSHRSWLTGHLTLVPKPSPSSLWVTDVARWDQCNGWSTILRRVGDEHCASTTRYLSTQHVVPLPSTVAHFIDALRTDPDTVWASSTRRGPRPLDQRLLIAALVPFRNCVPAGLERVGCGGDRSIVARSALGRPAQADLPGATGDARRCRALACLRQGDRPRGG